MKAVLFKSENRFDSFLNKMKYYKIDVTVLDFGESGWVDYDYSDTDIIVYFPTFKFTSNHPLALGEVYDNLIFLTEHYPNLKMFPDPHIIRYYNDKYRQFLFLKKNGFPIPETIPLSSQKMVEYAADKLGFPVVVKNRYGAGGDSVFMVNSINELNSMFQLSQLDLFNFPALKYYMKLISRKMFFYFLMKAKKMEYPFFSFPLLAQKFITMDKDLKTVVGDQEVVEAHWRRQTDEKMWKVNIDGGGIGEWSYVPQEALNLSEKLAKGLQTRWLNIDLVLSEGNFLITEFSPVWHHYAYREKESFVYKDDYNIKLPLEISLDLERIILESLMKAVENSQEEKTASHLRKKSERS